MDHYLMFSNHYGIRDLLHGVIPSVIWYRSRQGMPFLSVETLNRVVTDAMP